MFIKYKYRVFYVSFLLLFFLASGVNNNALAADEKQGNGKEDFNTGEMIFDHVMDSHEWHILTVDDKHITIPLPVILYDTNESDWHIFMSSKFHHGNRSYEGFMLNEEGDIVPVKPGTKMQPAQDLEKPMDLSITKTVAGIFITGIILLLVFIPIARRYKKHTYEPPKGGQALLEPLILFIRDDVARKSIDEDKYQRYMPFLLTLFFFILIANLLGLVPFFPGGVNITGNIGVTFVMAAFTFLMTVFSGNKHYWKEIFDAPGVPWWLKFLLPLMPIIEILGMFTKPFALMVRLFANMLSGHIVILGFMSLIFIFGIGNTLAGYGASVVSVALSVFMNLLHLLIAFIQAYVFTLLSALYFGMATEESH